MSRPKDFPEMLYIVREEEGDSRYLLAFETPEDAATHADGDDVIVGKYEFDQRATVVTHVEVKDG